MFPGNWGLTPFFDQTHNYTGAEGPIDSPRMPVLLDFRGLAEGHRTLSEQRIIAANQGRSTLKFNNLRVFFVRSASAPVCRPQDTSKPLFLITSGERHPRELSLANLVNVLRASGNLRAAVLDALSVYADGALLIIRKASEVLLTRPASLSK